MNGVYFNHKLKSEYINFLIDGSKDYYRAFDRIFKESCKFERAYNKDLYAFSENDLLEMYKELSYEKKYTTINTYNSLIVDYKNWALTKGAIVYNGVVSSDKLRQIKTYKQYTIWNDDDINEYTQETIIDGSDYNAVIFIRLYWEINANESVNTILKTKISDLNVDKNVIKIGRHEYNISKYLTSLIENYANYDYLLFENKHGEYRILKADENNGYFFRTAFNKNTNIGEPLDSAKMSNLIYRFSQRRLDERISVSDLTMSLALKYMLEKKKSHAEMFTEKVFFSNLPTQVYIDIFDNFAKKKFPQLYDEYVEFFQSLRKKYEKFL